MEQRRVDDLKRKLAVRLCSLAGTDVAHLTQKAKAFVERRTSKWVGGGVVPEAEVVKAAHDLQRRYPDSLPKTREAAGGATSSAAAMISAPLGHEAEQPLRASTTVPMAASPISNVSNGRASATLRPTVLRRIQHLQEDAEWQESVRKDLEQLENEKAQAQEARVSKKQRIWQDMKEAQRIYDEKRERERQEREESRKQVIREMADAKAEEAHILQERRKKFSEEKRCIDEQRRLHRQLAEKAAARRKEEAEQQRKEATREAKRLQDEEYEKASGVRDTLLSFLNQSRELLELKRKRAEEQKKTERSRELEDISGEHAELFRASDRRVKEKQFAKIRHREQLQAVVGNLYEGIEREREERAKELEKKTLIAMEKNYEEVEARAKRDMEKKQDMRRQLIRFLDEDMDARRAVRAQVVQEKSVARQRVDVEAENVKKEAVEHKLKKIEEQAKLRDGLDRQATERLTVCQLPIKLK